nr:ComEA family DNA-binding protein [Chloroflexota bacterium]
MEKHHEAVSVGLFLSLIFSSALGAMLLFIKKPVPAPIVIHPIPPPAAQPRVPTATPEPIQVYVSGAVAHPGVYVIPWDSRVQQAISAAGGATANADLARINLAQRVYDEQQIYVPALDELATPVLPTVVPRTTGSEMSAIPGRKININAASASELEILPGIGPALAQRIVDYRQSAGPFQHLEDIKKVKGIGDGIFAQIKELITIE